MGILRLDFLLAILAVAIATKVFLSRKKFPLPPGPKGLPVLGNLYDLPRSHGCLVYERWGREFNSDVIHLKLLNTSVIIVNSTQAASELFERRSTIYNDRPEMTMLNDLVGWDWGFAFMHYGDRWKQHRRDFHHFFLPTACLGYHNKLLKTSRGLLRDLLDKPDDFFSHIRYMTGSLLLDIAYGLEVKRKNDPIITIAEKAEFAVAQAGNAGAYLVDLIPILKYIPEWFPGANFQREAREWRKDVLATVDLPFKTVQKAISAGTAKPSMLLTLLDKLDDERSHAAEEREIASVTAMAYAAGSDTSAAAISTAFLALMLYPEVQRKAQAEIDRVVGSGRLPDFSDEESLPYISAVVREVLRWRPVNPLAVPHRVTKDDMYQGYLIPAGSIVVGNVWAMLHNPQAFPDPDVFKPERFLDANGQLDPAMKDIDVSTFGFGRRICPGRHLALAAVWITVASLMSTMELTKPMDDDGHLIEPSGEYTPGLLSYPKPFKCAFKPRSKAAEDLVRTTSLGWE